MNQEELIKEIYTGIFRWYSFREQAKILVVDTKWEMDPVSEARRSLIAWLEKSGFSVAVRGMEESKNTENGYDYVILYGVLEYSKEPVRLLKAVDKELAPQGKILIATDNRFGLRYFIGDQDSFTGRCFDGIENYERLFQMDREKIGGRAYASFELDEMLDMAGIEARKSYSVFPDIRYAQLLYAEGYRPNEELSIRYIPMYNHPETVFLTETAIIDDIAKNGMLDKMANGFFIECGEKEAELSDALQVTIAMDRGANGMITMIRQHPYPEHLPMLEGAYDPERSVEKIPQGETARQKVEALLKNAKSLEKAGLHVVPARVVDGRYTMPYITAEGGMTYFKKLALTGDKDALLTAVDLFWNMILTSSGKKECEINASFGEDKVSGKSIRCKEPGYLLKEGFVDLMPLNAFVVGNDFFFYDQEYCYEWYPAKAIMYRVIGHLNSLGKEYRELVSREELYERYGLMTDKVQWAKLEGKFIEKLRNRSVLQTFIKAHEPNATFIGTNRQRYNVSQEEYTNIFLNLFKQTEGKELIVFGTGKFAKHFVSMFKDRFPIRMLLDNDPKKQGTEMDGIPIENPKILTAMDPESYKLIICIRQYVYVLKQSKALGVKYYGIYDPDTEYELPECTDQAIKSEETQTETGKKPYRIGYIAGVFDMFHVGHLNVLRRAKEQCDHLIVGLCSDEWIREFKGTNPVIPFEDRQAIVQACKYVDEAVKIPTYAGDSMDAWRLYHFDAQFSGSDYENDPAWLNKKAELEKHGATIVFFPYTESVSSTKLKERLGK